MTTNQEPEVIVVQPALTIPADLPGRVAALTAQVNALLPILEPLCREVFESVFKPRAMFDIANAYADQPTERFDNVTGADELYNAVATIEALAAAAHAGNAENGLPPEWQTRWERDEQWPAIVANPEINEAYRDKVAHWIEVSDIREKAIADRVSGMEAKLDRLEEAVGYDLT